MKVFGWLVTVHGVGGRSGRYRCLDAGVGVQFAFDNTCVLKWSCRWLVQEMVVVKMDFLFLRGQLAVFSLNVVIERSGIDP